LAVAAEREAVQGLSMRLEAREREMAATARRLAAQEEDMALREDERQRSFRATLASATLAAETGVAGPLEALRTERDRSTAALAEREQELQAARRQVADLTGRLDSLEVAARQAATAAEERVRAKIAEVVK